MITGEPVPVEKQVGANVVGGTVNQTGALTFRATAVGAYTMRAQITRMVEVVQGSKFPIQAPVDRVTLWSVPAVMATATLIFLVWAVFGPEPGTVRSRLSSRGDGPAYNLTSRRPKTRKHCHPSSR